ncbi:MAG: exodeoxyribonuclease VII large subunit [Deltaproteobacteria bacterium]|jgi:exodeoxyribonuclease VII large subunit|nr:exodeoxyribonuclease VII large subunit [Deltaproteobacteria bacterium]
MAPPAGEEKRYTPSQLTLRIRDNFDAHFGDIVVDGEAGGITKAASGHVYLQIKDAESNLKAVVWRSNALRSGIGPVRQGMMVSARGALSVYGLRSEYQLIVSQIMPMGQGSLMQAYENLKKKLAAEGLFEPGNKRLAPVPPRRVALIAAKGSAAASDFVTTAVKRMAGAWVTLCPARVQGKGAAEEMAAALEFVNGLRDFDLVVMTRGGGSLEDLWSFNEEVLVRAVARSRLPVLAAVGHSTDLSLVEMAADQQAITPTAAAEAVFPKDSDRVLEIRGLARELRNLAVSAVRGWRGEWQRATARLGQLAYMLKNYAQLIDNNVFQLRSAVGALLSRRRAELGRLDKDLAYLSPRRDLAEKRARLTDLTEALQKLAGPVVAEKTRELAALRESLELVSPLAVLRRGYGVVTDERGLVVASVRGLAPGRGLGVRLQDGRFSARVEGPVNSD